MPDIGDEATPGLAALVRNIPKVPRFTGRPWGRKRLYYLLEMIHFGEGDTGSAILASDYGGVLPGSHGRDNR